jgi:hypothetical protein
VRGMLDSYQGMASAMPPPSDFDSGPAGDH